MATAARERQLAAMRKWRLDHPGSYRQWTKEYRQWRDSQKSQGVNVMGNSRPLVDGQLAYEVVPTVKLSEEERIQPELEEPKHASQPKKNKPTTCSQCSNGSSGRPAVHKHNERVNPTSVPRLQPEP